MRQRKKLSKQLSVILTLFLVMGSWPISAAQGATNANIVTNQVLADGEEYISSGTEEGLFKLIDVDEEEQKDTNSESFSEGEDETFTEEVNDNQEGEVDILSVAIIFIEDESGETNLYIEEGQTVTIDDLLEGVSAIDEMETSVEVSVTDLGGLELEKPVFAEDWAYTITYEAMHPISEQIFTAYRTVWVTAGVSAIAFEQESFIFDISEGNIEIYSGTTSETVKVRYCGIDFDNIPNNQEITIIGDSTNYSIIVSANVNTHIKLSNVNIDVDYMEDSAAFHIKGGASVLLTLEGENSLISGMNCAGLQVSRGAVLELTADNEHQTLTAIGGIYGAGIGGGNRETSGTINIFGGTVNAISRDFGAGIGGGNGGANNAINISGGIVTATSDRNGAGIGGGDGGAGGTIAISGGTVVALGGSDAKDIGPGVNGRDGSINIIGGSVCPINGNVSPRPTDGSESVYLNTLTVGDPAMEDNIAITTVSLEDYSINEVQTTQGGRLFFWLPATNKAETFFVKTSNDMYENRWVCEGVESEHTLHMVNTIESGNVIIIQGNDEYTVEIGNDTYGPYSYAIEYTITNYTGANSITIETDLNVENLPVVKLLLSDVKISSKTAAINMKPETIVRLTIEGENSLKSGSKYAGLQVLEDADLELTARDERQTLTATGGNYGAGIGGGNDDKVGTINISGGAIVAKGGNNSSGVGSGNKGGNGIINISGGTINADGGSSGAGIGGGNNSTTNIYGGEITANGKSGVGIGGGNNSTINIHSGKITANGNSGAGIGSRSGSNILINIYGGEVTANGKSGAGIGSSGNGTNCVININDGVVIANGGNFYPGIGGGGNSMSHNITINGGEVTATGGNLNTLGISGAECSKDDIITVTDGIVTAVGGIGGDYSTIIISGGTVMSASDGNKEGIGGNNTSIIISGGTVMSASDGNKEGIGGNNTSIIISGGTIKSLSKRSGAGIGGYKSTVEISGGLITASGVADGTGIGGTFATVEISGGTVNGKGRTGIGGTTATVKISGGTVAAIGDNNNKDIIVNSDGLIITGGSLWLAHGSLSRTPTNGSSLVYLNTLTVGEPNVGCKKSVTAMMPAGYGINDVETTEGGKLYLWLPATSSAETVSVTVDGNVYQNTWVRTTSTETRQTLYIN